jgi:hypothetical protein
MRLALTDKIVRMIGKADRQKFGLRTLDEVAAQSEVKSERELHKQVANLLRLRGIEFVESRMDRKTTNQVGTPDFLFAIQHKPKPDGSTASLLNWAVACGWEIKMPNKKLDVEQEKMFERMPVQPNGWRCCVISSVDQALEELKRLGVP